MHRAILVIVLLSLGVGVVSSFSAARAQLPSPQGPAENPLTPEKAVLGKALFWDEQLSSDNTMACGTCHRPAEGGADPRREGIALGE